MLKGANSSYRSVALRDLRFDEHLRGEVPQPYKDYRFGMTMKRAGWTLGYDPAVDHYHSPANRGTRVTGETRHGFSSAASTNRVHNQGFVVLWSAFLRHRDSPSRFTPCSSVRAAVTAFCGGSGPSQARAGWPGRSCGWP
jgi:hypothetical protein